MKRFCKVYVTAVITCLFSLAIALGSLFTADAGISELSVFNSDVLTGAEELPGSLWYYEKSDNSGTTVLNNEITFAPDKYADSRFNLKRKIADLSYCNVELNFELNGEFLFSEMPQGARFVFAFGMAKVNSYPANKSTALYFENKAGTVGFGIDVYDGNSKTVKTPFAAITGYSASEYVSVHFKVNSDGTGSGSVNGEEFIASGLPTSGYAGFGQIVEEKPYVVVALKDLSILAYENATPENTDVFEDFNQNCFNENVFQAKSRASGLANSKLCVENKALTFSNTGSAYIETKDKYSNVDVAFDVVDVKKETTFAPDGTINVSRSCAFGLAFGIDVIGRNMQTKAPLTVGFVPERGVKTNTSVVIKSGANELASVVLPEKYDLFERDGVFGVKISVRDGKVAVMMKNSEEKGYAVVVRKELGFTPFGYFQIAALGAYDSNLQKGLAAEQLLVGSFSIDNLSVKNYDVGKQLKLVDYLCSNATLATDYVYENEWLNSDLLESTTK